MCSACNRLLPLGNQHLLSASSNIALAVTPPVSPLQSPCCGSGTLTLSQKRVMPMNQLRQSASSTKAYTRACHSSCTMRLKMCRSRLTRRRPDGRSRPTDAHDTNDTHIMSYGQHSWFMLTMVCTDTRARCTRTETNSRPAPKLLPYLGMGHHDAGTCSCTGKIHRQGRTVRASAHAHPVDTGLQAALSC